MAPPRHTSNLGAILNDEEPKPKLLLDENQLFEFHEKLIKSTSGCSLEQLEQVNAALMDAIWKHRSDYNRNVVLHEVSSAFNVIIADIQVMQQIMKLSQETPEPETQYTSVHGPGVSRRTGYLGSHDDAYVGTQQPGHHP
jgi:hypothetical protein